MNDLLPSLSDQLNRVLASLPLFKPELYLCALFLVVLVTDLIFGRNSAKLCRAVTIGGMLLVILQVLLQYGLTLGPPTFIFSEMLLLTHDIVVFKLIIDVMAVVIFLYIPFDDRLAGHRKGLSDLYTVAIATVFGLHLMVMAVNLLSIYVSVELVSIASYLMVAYHTGNAKGLEAGLKYVLFGAAASAVMLYGISLLYVSGGSLGLYYGSLMSNLKQANPAMVAMAISLVLVGIGFKLSFVPVHFWVPDVYEGAPTPVTAWLSTLPKIAGFGLLVNVLYPVVSNIHTFDIRLILSVIAVITMIAGNFAAVMQKNVKRMLAYSSIGHTGFALMAVVTMQIPATTLTFYLVAYTLASVAALMLATYFTNNEGAETVEEYKGFGFRYPVASVCFVVVLISLTGIPVTAGFTGKLLVFAAAYNNYEHTHDVWMLIMMITGAVTTVVSLFYYIRVPLNLFLRHIDNQVDSASTGRYLLSIVIVISVLLVAIGIYPSLVTTFL